MASEILTRSSVLPDQLDSDAIAQISVMVEGGWSPETAAQSWVDWVQVVAESAADGAIAEIAWEAE